MAGVLNNQNPILMENNKIMSLFSVSIEWGNGKIRSRCIPYLLKCQYSDFVQYARGCAIITK